VSDWINELEALLGKNYVFTEDAVLQLHSGDAWLAKSMPQVVVMAETTEQVSQVLKFANERKIPVTARGGGKGYVGSCVPVKGGISLDLMRMNKILEINGHDFVAVVEPGVITADLQEEAIENGLFYPPDPASMRDCSIGGNIATNAGGARCLKYGVTKNYVLGLEVVLANGDILQLGGRTHKNKTGFNLTDLFIGSEGMLGIVTKVIVKLLPYPPARVVTMISFDDLKETVKAIQLIQENGFLPSAMEIGDQLVVASARKVGQQLPPGNVLLLLEFDGQPDAIKHELEEAIKLLQTGTDLKHFVVATDEIECEKIWGIRRDFAVTLKRAGMERLNEDIVVPRGKLLDLFTFIDELQKTYDVPMTSFGHAGDGNIHVNLMIDQTKDFYDPQLHNLLNDLFKQVLAWGGVITGEHGVGLAKKPWWTNAVSPEVNALHKVIKNALDPHGILNPGKFLDE
jgi:glycolate oxidase